jgi:molybdate transport system substrate-binding protein
MHTLYKNFIFSIALAILSCATQASEVNIYAAASLMDAITELSGAYQKLHPDAVIKKSFAGSATLAKQIENGAPADIFISADNDWSDYLQKRGLLAAESRKTLLSNALVLIAPINKEPTILLDPAFNFSASFNGHLCTGDPASVPVGKYAKQALIYFGWWGKIAPRLVGTDDVRTALAFVERAECDLGIVYKTDAALSKKIKIVATFPENSHALIEYSGALTKKYNQDAKSFWLYLQSSEAKIIFVRYGFIALN